MPLGAIRRRLLGGLTLDPGDVWRRTREKGSGRRGEMLEIETIRVENSQSVHVSVRYGVKSSVLHLTRRGEEWTVAAENVTAITVTPNHYRWTP